MSAGRSADASCDVVGIARPIVYGHSMGGFVAMLLRMFDVVDQLRRIDCPTLVCVGELDAVTPVDAAQEVYDALPHGLGRIEVIEGAGHFPWKDAPDRYLRVLEDFVTGGEPRDM